MKIGAFAKQFDVSIDTVRYYIDLGLLVPVKQKTQYEMDQTCVEDMTFITELKKLHFSLQEIHKILSYKRITHFREENDIHYFVNLLTEKKAKLAEELNQIAQTIQRIDQIIEETSKSQVQEAGKGMPLSFMSYLYCPSCRVPLKMTEASIQQTSVYDGVLTCPCGYQAELFEGILITDNVTTSPYHSCIYDEEIIKEWSPNFISLTEKSCLSMYKELSRHDLKHKLIVETNVDIFVSMTKYLPLLGEEVNYVFCGHSLEMMKRLKKRVEYSCPNATVLYIVNSDLQLPLRPQSIDYFVDSFSFNQFSLLNKRLPCEILAPYLHGDSRILGTYMFFAPASKSLKKIKEMYPDPHPKAYALGYLEENMDGLDAKRFQKEHVGQTDNPGSYFIYHVEQEMAHLYAYQYAYKERG